MAVDQSNLLRNPWSRYRSEVNLPMLFISHSSRDTVYVSALADRLQKEGLKLWFDHQEIQVAVSIPASMSEGLASADHLLVVWSASAKASPHVQNEIDAFYIKSPQPELILFVRLDTEPVPTLYAARRYLSSAGDITSDSNLIKCWAQSMPGVDATISEAEASSEQTVALIPKGPRVERYLVTDNLVAAYADLLSSRAKAEQTLERAIRLRLQADPSDPRVTVISSGDLPNIGVVGATTYWQDVFTQAALQGPRMLAALLLAQPDDLFPNEARSDRARLLFYLRTGIKPQLQN